MSSHEHGDLSAQLSLAALRGRPNVMAASVISWLEAGAPELDTPLTPEQQSAADRCRELLNLTRAALAELMPAALAARRGLNLNDLMDGAGQRACVALNTTNYLWDAPGPVRPEHWAGITQAWGAAQMIRNLSATLRTLAAGHTGEGNPDNPHWRAGRGEASRAEARLLERWVKLLPPSPWLEHLNLDPSGFLMHLKDTRHARDWLIRSAPVTAQEHWERQIIQRFHYVDRSQFTPDRLLSLSGRPRPGETSPTPTEDEWSNLQALIRAQPPVPNLIFKIDPPKVSALMGLRLPPCDAPPGHPWRALLLAVAAREIMSQGLDFVTYWPLSPTNQWQADQLTDARALLALLKRQHDAGHLKHEPELSRLSVALTRHLRLA